MRRLEAESTGKLTFCCSAVALWRSYSKEAAQVLLLPSCTWHFFGLREKVSAGLLCARMDRNDMLCLYKLAGILIAVSLRAGRRVAVRILRQVFLFSPRRVCRLYA